MEKAGGGSFGCTARKRAEDEDEDEPEDDWDMALNRYQGLPWVNFSQPDGP
jgi:hypothetical protein